MLTRSPRRVIVAELSVTFCQLAILRLSRITVGSSSTESLGKLLADAVVRRAQRVISKMRIAFGGC